MDIESCATAAMEHHDDLLIKSTKGFDVSIKSNNSDNKDENRIDEDDNCNNISIPKESKNLINELVSKNDEKLETTTNDDDNENQHSDEILLCLTTNAIDEHESTEIAYSVDENEENGDVDADADVNIIKTEKQMEEVSSENELDKSNLSKLDETVLSNDQEEDNYKDESDDTVDKDVTKVNQADDDDEDEDETSEDEVEKNGVNNLDVDNEDDDEVDDSDDDDDEEEEEDNDDDDDDDNNAVDDYEEEDSPVEVIISSDEEEEVTINRQETSKTMNMKINYKKDDIYGEDDDDDYDDDEVYSGDNDLMNEVFMLPKNTERYSQASTSVSKDKRKGREEIKKCYNKFRIQAIKRSIKWLNDRRSRKLNAFIHTIKQKQQQQLPIPSVSRKDVNDDKIIPTKSNYNNAGQQLSKIKEQLQHYEQQQRQQQQKYQKEKEFNNLPSSSKEIISIDIEDSPEKESCKINKNTNSDKMKSESLPSSSVSRNFNSFKFSSSSPSLPSSSYSMKPYEKNNDSDEGQEESQHNFNENKTNQESLRMDIDGDENIVENKIQQHEENNNKNKSEMIIENISTSNTENDVTMVNVQDENNKKKDNDSITDNHQEENLKNHDSYCQERENPKEEKQEKKLSEFEIVKETESKNDEKLEKLNDDKQLKDNDTKKLLQLPEQSSSDSRIDKDNLNNSLPSSVSIQNQKDEKEHEGHIVEDKRSSDRMPSSSSSSSEAPLKRKRSLSNCTENYPTTTTPAIEKNFNKDSELIHPIKKLRAELQLNFSIHNKMLNDYIEKISNDSMSEIQKHLDQLILEIQTLNKMIRSNEIEWENMLHLKKVKEELCYRLTRKKHAAEIMSSSLSKCNEPDDDGDNNLEESSIMKSTTISGDNNSNIRIQQEQEENDERNEQQNEILLNKIENIVSNILTSTPNTTDTSNLINTIEEGLEQRLSSLPNAVTSDKITNVENLQNFNNQNDSSPTGITKSILQSCANMKSSDLVKERANLQKFHRLLVSRNILPKPSSSSLLFGSLGVTNATTASTIGTTSTPSHLVPLSVQNISTPPTAINLMQQKSLFTTVNDTPQILRNSRHHHQEQQQQQQQQQQPTIFSSYLNENDSVQQQLDEMLNGYYQHQQQQQQNSIGGINQQRPVMVGRQGVFKDVKSIIADYRQKHPEVIPRRGRRLKGVGGNASNQLNTAETNSILGNALKSDYGNSRPSSNDSSHSISNVLGANINNTNLGSTSFKDILVQFAKISGQTGIDRGAKSVTTSSNNQIQGTTLTPSYPEVTLHPVVTSQSNASDQATGSLLHGILTKYSRPNNSTSTSTATATISAAATSSTAAANQGSNYKSSFSPTLARLLTAPERITSIPSSCSVPISTSSNTGNLTSSTSSAAAAVMAAAGLNLSKVVGQNSEVTITPVTPSQLSIQQAIMQQQQQQLQLHHHHQQQEQQKQRERDRQELLQHQQQIKELLAAKERYYMEDEEADDSVDRRLVIDESGHTATGGIDECHRIAPQEINENEVPVCQGCKKKEAQFVCAGCGNQWYCSRSCQVNAWDEHSEVCAG